MSETNPEDSIFTKMIKGEVPCYKVYEDDRTIVIVPLHPKALAHVLVIPKLQVDQFYDLPQEDYMAVMNVVQRVAKHIKTVIKPKRVGLEVIGIHVPHAHIHVIAFDTFEQFVTTPDENGPVDHRKLAAMAQKLAIKDLEDV
jgi:histidine triad (HIT) family protein